MSSPNVETYRNPKLMISLVIANFCTQGKALQKENTTKYMQLQWRIITSNVKMCKYV